MVPSTNGRERAIPDHVPDSAFVQANSLCVSLWERLLQRLLQRLGLR